MFEYAILFGFCALQVSQAAAAGPIVIAHRGASGYLPEHTLEAYAMAHALGADYIEPDVVLTKDARFICLHDIYLEATTNVEEVYPDRCREDAQWYAADFTLDEIKRLQVHERLKGRFPVRASNFEVPTFEEMIELVQGLNKTTGREVGIYPELKAPAWHREQGLAMEEAFLDVVGRYGYKGERARIYVQCFEAEPLRRMRQLGSKLPQVQLIGSDGEYDPMVTPEGLAAIAGYANGIGPAKKRIRKNPALVEWAHEAELVVHPYTFRADDLPLGTLSFDKELSRYLIDYGVDGLFTDFADKVVVFVEENQG